MIVDGERVKAILGIKGATKYGKTRDYSTRMAYEIVDAIDDAVISESELLREQIRPNSKWIKVTNMRGGHECNLCHNYAPSWKTGDENLSAYCPSCGAHMRSEE